MSGPFRPVCPALCFLVFSCHAFFPVSLHANDGVTWTQMEGSQGRFVLDIDLFPQNPDSTFALCTDVLLFSSNGGAGWDSIAAGSCCGVLATSGEDASRLFMNHTGIPYPGNVVSLSTDRGESWSEITRGMCAGFETCAAHFFKRGPGTSPALYASLNPYILLRTEDDGLTWDSLSIPQNYGLWSVEISHQDPSVLYLAYSTPVGAYRSDDGGLSWQKLPFPNIAEDTAVLLAIDPRNHDVVYAGVRGQTLLKSTDGGQFWSWMNLGLRQENLSFNSIVVNPHNPDEVYIGVADSVTGDGESEMVFVSVDGAVSWTPLSEGLPDAGHVSTLAIDPRSIRILAAVNSLNDSSRASGIYVLEPETGVATNPLSPFFPPKVFQNSPNPFNGRTTIRFILQKRGSATVRLHTVTGQLLRVLLDQELDQGEHRIVFDAGGLSTGIYFYTLETAEGRVTRRMTLLR